MRVTMFIGDDFHSQMLVSHFLELAKSVNWQVQVLTVTRRSEGSAHELIQVWRKIETRVFPALALAMEEKCSETALKDVVDNHFRNKGAIWTGAVSDVNDPDLVSDLSASRQNLIVAVRCYQKFSASTIGAFATDGGLSRLLNLHPGRLPEYRGVMTYLHQLANSDVLGTHSLHVISPNWDDGPLLAVNSDRLRLDRTLTANYYVAAEAGARLLFKQAAQIDCIGVDGYFLTARPQSDEDANYHSSADAIKSLENGPVKLFDLKELRNLVCERFGATRADSFVRNLHSMSGCTSDLS